MEMVYYSRRVRIVVKGGHPAGLSLVVGNHLSATCGNVLLREAEALEDLRGREQYRSEGAGSR